MGNLRHGMRGNRAGEKQEHGHRGQLDADQGKTFMDHHAKDDKTNACGIHHSDCVNATEHIREPDQTKAANDERKCADCQ